MHFSLSRLCLRGRRCIKSLGRQNWRVWGGIALLFMHFSLSRLRLRGPRAVNLEVILAYGRVLRNKLSRVHIFLFQKKKSSHISLIYWVIAYIFGFPHLMRRCIFKLRHSLTLPSLNLQIFDFSLCICNLYQLSYTKKCVYIVWIWKVIRQVFLFSSFLSSNLLYYFII